MKLKEYINKLHETRREIVSLIHPSQGLNETNIIEAYRGIEQAITALEKISEELDNQHDNQDNHL